MQTMQANNQGIYGIDSITQAWVQHHPLSPISLRSDLRLRIAKHVSLRRFSQKVYLTDDPLYTI